jgi:hypothetical protein
VGRCIHTWVQCRAPTLRRGATCRAERTASCRRVRPSWVRGLRRRECPIGVGQGLRRRGKRKGRAPWRAPEIRERASRSPVVCRGRPDRSMGARTAWSLPISNPESEELMCTEATLRLFIVSSPAPCPSQHRAQRCHHTPQTHIITHALNIYDGRSRRRRKGRQEESGASSRKG